MMSITGIFSDPPDLLFDGDKHFEVAHSENVGTLVFSGWGHQGSTQVYIITNNPKWNKIESSDKYLNPFKNPTSARDYYLYGVVEKDDKIYLVGGWSTNGKTIQYIDFTTVRTLEDAQTTQWSFLQNLEIDVKYPAVIYSDGILLVIGGATCAVQYFDLALNTTGVQCTPVVLRAHCARSHY